MKAHEHIREALQQMGFDKCDYDEETPSRIIKFWDEFAYKGSPPKLTTFTKDSDTDGIVIVRDITFVSLCRHHFLPFWGTFDVAYIPRQLVIGLSKIPRYVEWCSKRPTLQEDLTSAVSKGIDVATKSLGVAAVSTAKHSCVTCRGVRSHDATMKFSALRGVFLSQGNARTELMELLRR